MLPPGAIESFGLYLVRTSAIVLGSPLSGGASTVGSYKVALIGSLAALSFWLVGSPVQPGYQPLDYGLWALREVLIGVSLAFILQLTVMAVSVSGDLIGHEMAFATASVADPVSGVNTPLVSRIYEILFLIGLLSVNGHHWLFRALIESYERAPIASIEFNGSLSILMVQLFGELFAAGLTFAAPIIVLLMLVTILVGLLSRAVPQLNILEFSFSMRIVAGLGAMCLFAPFLVPAMEALLGHLMNGLDSGLDALEI